MVVADALAPFVLTLLALGHGDRAIAAFTAELARAAGRGLAMAQPLRL